MRAGHRAEHPLLGQPRRDLVTTIVLSLVTAALFILVGFEGTRRSIQGIDDGFLELMVSIRSGALTGVAKAFDLLGRVAVTLPVRLAAGAYLAAKRRWWHLAAFGSAMVLSEIAIGPVKALYERPRPPGSLVTISASSFPSGHAVAASVTAVALVIALFPEGPRRYGWGVAAAIFSLFMALSRAYLAAHWLSDAVAGTLLGTTAALGCAVVVHGIREGRSGSATEAESPESRGTPLQGPGQETPAPHSRKPY